MSVQNLNCAIYIPAYVELVVLSSAVAPRTSLKTQWFNFFMGLF